MYRLLGIILQPKVEQIPGKSNRQSSGPQKGQTDRESLK
jgi:hypothetical protein